jgi:hypothetical protein
MKQYEVYSEYTKNSNSKMVRSINFLNTHKPKASVIKFSFNNCWMFGEYFRDSGKVKTIDAIIGEVVDTTE